MASELGWQSFHLTKCIYIVSFKELSPMHSTVELSPVHSTIHRLGLVGVGSDPTSDTMSSNNKLTMYNHMHACVYIQCSLTRMCEYMQEIC